MPSIIQKPIGRNCVFQNQLYKPLWFVVHFTGGTPNLQSLYNYWLSQCGIGSNSHFGIERYTNQYAKAGDIWQFVDYTRDGACANCCLEAGYAPFLPSGVNMNVRTISVECINPDSGNNGEMPQAQFDSLVYLIQKVCSDMGIATNKYTEYWNGYETAYTFADGGGGVIMHRDIAPRNRRMCPGTPYYSNSSTSMKAVMQAVNSGVVPIGKRRIPQLTQITAINKPVLLCPPPGNSTLEIGVDFSDANVRVAGHIEGATRWEIKEFNTRPSYNQWSIDIGPGKWQVDKVSVTVTEFNPPTGFACSATIWPI